MKRDESNSSVTIDPTKAKIEDEEDTDDDLSDQAQSMFCSYRRIGVMFLVAAVLVAAITAILPPSLATTNISWISNGYLFRALLVVFLVFLFSCLYCTYYLGGAKDTWENPTFTGIRLNFSNVTAILGLFVEFLQVCSFSFNQKAAYRGLLNLQNIRYVALPYDEGESFRVMYWVMFVIAFSPYIFVVTVRMIIYYITHKKGEAEAAAFVQQYQQKIYSILWFLVNTLYLPVISAMMSGVDCTFTKTGATMDSETSTHCLQGKHIGYIVCSLVALIIYYPAASFAQSQTQNISDIKFKPKIVFVFVQGKVILAGFTIFFTNFTASYLAVVIIIDLAFLGINIYFQPCIIQWVNRLRSVFFALTVWATLCSWLAFAIGNPDSTVPLIILCLGFIFLAALGYFWDTVLHLAGRKPTPPPTNTV